MYVEMLVACLSGPSGTYRGGAVYDVPDDVASHWIARGAAKPSSVPPVHVAAFYGRLAQGADQPCLFAPSLGEFGHRVMTGMRLIHWHRASRKVVCCRAGEQVLYPSAEEFFTDWTDPVDDTKRGGAGPAMRWPAIEARYPGHTLIQTGDLTPCQEKICIHPEQRIPLRPRLRGLQADVCLGIRNRAFCKEKNWPAWQFVADAITAAGYTFAIIGTRPTTLDLAGQTHHSADYDTDAAVELLQNCRLYVGTDTGTSHLAATIRANMLVFRQEWSRNRDLRPCMAERNPGRVESMPAGSWTEPDRIIARTLEKLRGRNGDD